MEAASAMESLWPVPVRGLVGRPLRIGAVDVGTVVDVLASPSLAYVFGLEIGGRDGHRHFVPWVATVVVDHHVALTSVHSLLSSSELALYVDNGLRLTDAAPEASIARDGVIAETAIDSGDAIWSKRRVHASAKRPIP
jgi:hypothetical protein